MRSFAAPMLRTMSTGTTARAATGFSRQNVLRAAAAGGAAALVATSVASSAPSTQTGRQFKDELHAGKTHRPALLRPAFPALRNKKLPANTRRASPRIGRAYGGVPWRPFVGKPKIGLFLNTQSQMVAEQVCWRRKALLGLQHCATWGWHAFGMRVHVDPTGPARRNKGTGESRETAGGRGSSVARSVHSERGWLRSTETASLRIVQMSFSGYDWLLVDTQHGGMDRQNMPNMLAGIHAGGAKSCVEHTLPPFRPPILCTSTC